MTHKLKNLFKKTRKYSNDGKSGMEDFHLQQKEAEQQKRNIIFYYENARQFSR